MLVKAYGFAKEKAKSFLSFIEYDEILLKSREHTIPNFHYTIFVFRLFVGLGIMVAATYGNTFPNILEPNSRILLFLFGIGKHLAL